MTQSGALLQFRLDTRDRAAWLQMLDRMRIGQAASGLSRDQKIQTLTDHLHEFGAVIQQLRHPVTIFWFDSEDEMIRFKTHMDTMITSFPHVVVVRNWQIQADAAQWCLRNIDIHDWLHDPCQFEFRHHTDMVMFSLTWSND